MANISFDWYNKYILHDETDIAIDALEVYSKAKDEEDYLHIAMSEDIIMTASGKDSLGGGKFTGVTLVLRNGWTYKCRTTPISDITIKISGANTIAENGIVFTHMDNIHYEIDQSTSPALIITTGGSSAGVNFYRSLDR